MFGHLAIRISELHRNLDLLLSSRRFVIYYIVAGMIAPLAIVVSSALGTSRYDDLIFPAAFLWIIGVLSLGVVLRNHFVDWRDRDWQFSLRTLLIFTTVVAVSLGAATWVSGK